MDREQETTCSKVSFYPGDTMEERLKKAAHVKPSQAVLAWQKKEMVAFIHYGQNTFNERQWGNGNSRSISVHRSGCEAVG